MATFVIRVALLAALGLAVAWTDLRSRTIPNPLLLSGAAAVAGWQVLAGHPAVLLWGGLVPALFGGLLWWRRAAGFGGGDWKYWTVIGMALGPGGACWAMALAAAGALLWGIASGDWRRRGARAAIAFGPWLAAASVAAAVWMPRLK